MSLELRNSILSWLSQSSWSQTALVQILALPLTSWLDKLCAYPKVLFWRLNRLVSIQELPNELDKCTYKSLMQLLTCSWYEFCKFCLNFCLYQGKVLTIIVIILDTFSFYSCKQEGFLTWKFCSNLDFLALINIINQFTIIRILISFRSDKTSLLPCESKMKIM